jgi:hypothetical protein
MKAFTFRLEHALRWRETQVGLQKSRVAVSAGRVAEIEATLDALRSELSIAAAGIIDGPTGIALESYSRFHERSSARIRDFEAQALAAQRALVLEMNTLIEAGQKVRLLENFKQSEQGCWRREFDRELVAFADEAFRSRAQSKNRARGQAPKTPIGVELGALR